MSNSKLNYPKIGIGTYLGDLNHSIDKKIYDVIIEAINNGINLIDTAPNYRCERSEKIIGNIISNFNREDLVISTKVGFLPFDKKEPTDYDRYFHDRFIDSGIVDIKNVYGDWQSFDPDYINWQLNESLKRLKTNYIDIYYLHNPDELLDFMKPDDFYSIIYDAFKFCNKMIIAGKIKYIGISTWNGFLRVNDSLDLNEIISISKATLDSDAFKFIQIPYNLALTDHLTQMNQINLKKNRKCSLINLANFNNIDVITSAPFYHGRLIEMDLPQKVIKMIEGVNNNAELSLKFSLSNPGANAVLVGVTDLLHLKEIISILNQDFISFNDYIKILKST